MKARNLALAAGVLAAALLGAWWGRGPALTAPDVAQPRLSQAAPVPAPGASLVQSFSVEHNGLSAVTVLAVYYGEPGDGQAALDLRLWDTDERLVAQASPRAFDHNAELQLAFSPLPNSAGRVYRLEVLPAGAGQATVWAYALDGLPGGELRLGGQPVPGDLHFRTEYTYLWPDLLRDAVAALGRVSAALAALWLVVFAPGLLLLDAVRLRAFNPTRWWRWGMAMGMSLALVPLWWLWVTVLGLAWSPVGLGAVYAVLGSVVAGRWLRSVVGRVRFSVQRRRARVQVGPLPGAPPVPVALAAAPPARSFNLHDGVMAGLLLAAVVLRLVAIRDLALPAWADSSHHAFVAGLLAESGRVPAEYGPLPEPGVFTYHFGVHSLLVTLSWLSPLDLTETMLVAGQVLNGLMPLAVYALALALTGRPLAALIAAFHVGVVSFFPGYYATWGRYSQLAGLLQLGPALGAVWLLAAGAPEGRAANPPGAAWPWRLAVCAGLLAAGLFLTHYRVWLFLVSFVPIAGLLHVHWGARSLLGLAGAGLAGGLLAAPWLLRLWVSSVVPIANQPTGFGAPPGYNDFPVAYFGSGLERAALVLAALAALVGLWRCNAAVWAMALWVGGIFLALNLGAATWLVNNNAWAISLFMPVAVLVGLGLAHGLDYARRLLSGGSRPAGAPAWQRAACTGLGACLVVGAAGLGGYATAAGSRLQVGIINPVTVLAHPADVAALDWVTEHTPHDAVFVVNGWNWLNAGWAGSDGGAWIMPYTGRQATLPPVTYSFGRASMQAQVGDLAARVAQIVDANAPETLALLRQAGVTHVFIGARGGHLKPEMFSDSPHYRLLYTNGAAWVFALAQPAP